MTMLTEDTGEHELLFYEEDPDAITYGRHSAAEAKPETLEVRRGKHNVKADIERELTVADIVRRLVAERPLSFEEKVTALGQAFDELDEGVLLKPYRPGRHAPAVDPDATVGFMPINTTTRRAGGPIRRGQLLVVSNEDAAVKAFRTLGSPVAGETRPTPPDATLVSNDLTGDANRLMAKIIEDYRHTPQPNPWQRFVAKVKKIGSQWT